jgi:AcrR family transcriptional regulator
MALQSDPMTEAAAARRGPGRPARINRDRIVEAVAATENLDALTMRELAARLGVSHGALYRWVRNRDELFDLLSDVLVDRVLEPVDGTASTPELLATTAWAMHDHFLALPGYATHLSRPHRHTAHAVDGLREVIVGAFLRDGVDGPMAEQSWHIFVTSTVSWLAAAENPLDLGGVTPRFDLFLDVLLRGLPAREPGVRAPRARHHDGATGSR